MRVGSLFSGIGGIDLGLQRAGMEIAWQVEIDEWCRRVLAKHWPDVERFGDIRDVGSHNLATVDVLAGGFPCQPVSHAGKRQAQDDARWLWPEYARLVRELRPRYVFVENVPGLLDGPMADVLGDLAACGYDAEWDCIPAAAVGAPHLRERYWILAYPEGERCGTRWAGRSDSSNPRQPERALSAVADAHEPRLQGRPSASLSGRGAATRHVGESDWWKSEPAVGRVAHGIPTELDCIGGLEREGGDGTQTIAEVEAAIGRVLRYVWEHQELAAASPDVYRRGLCDLVPGMSYERACGGWLLGKRLAAYEGLRDLWEAFYAASQHEAQDLQRRVLERARKAKRPPDVASRTDRLRGLGNAVVPQIVEWIGRRIVSLEATA